MRWFPGGRLFVPDLPFRFPTIPFAGGKVSEPGIRNTAPLPALGNDQSKFVKAVGPGIPTMGALPSISFGSLAIVISMTPLSETGDEAG